MATERANEFSENKAGIFIDLSKAAPNLEQSGIAVNRTMGEKATSLFAQPGAASMQDKIDTQATFQALKGTLQDPGIQWNHPPDAASDLKYGVVQTMNMAKEAGSEIFGAIFGKKEADAPDMTQQAQPGQAPSLALNNFQPRPPGMAFGL